MTVIDDMYKVLFGRTGTTRGTDIDFAEHGRSGGVSTGQPFKFTDSVNYATKITESGSYTYIAWANPGSLEGTACWKVMRIDDSTGMVITWADGDTKFNNKATDLTTLTYS